MITNFKLFLEKFSQVNLDDIDYDVIYQKDEWLDNAELIPSVYLKKSNKDIHIHWYDAPTHPMKDKINTRTPVNSIQEFNKIIDDSLNILFDKYFKAIEKKMNQYKLNRIAVHVPELYGYLIIEYDPDLLYKDFTYINILTVLPKLTTVGRINRIFYL